MKQTLIVALMIFSIGYSFSQQVVGEEVLLQFESQHPYDVGTRSGEIVWTQEIHYTATEASYIALHFASFNIAEDDTLRLRSPDYSRIWNYTSDNNNRGDFWSIPIYGDKAIIEIISSSQNGSYGYSIDRITRGFTFDEIQQLNGDGVCGIDDRENAKCYELTEPTVYNKSNAVARLWDEERKAICTGFLFGDEGHLMTCNHCVPGSISPSKTYVEMMAEGNDCDADCIGNGFCRGVPVAEGVTIIQTNPVLDYSLLLPNYFEDVSLSDYGYLTMRTTGPIQDERIYIPQHPWGYGKLIAVYSDNQNDNGFPLIHSFTEASCWHGYANNRVGYYADTNQGSSGAPVLSYEDHCVVAMHGCGGNCPNNGANSTLILQDLDYIPNNALGGEIQCGGGEDESIVQDRIYNSYHHIPGSLFIENNATVTVTGKMEFGPDKSIIVEDGGKLIIDGGWLTNCYDATEFWKGIEVKDGGMLEISGNTKITDAHIGVNGYPGADIDIYNCEISNVDVGIKVKDAENLSCFESLIQQCTIGIYCINTTYPFLSEITYKDAQFGVMLDKSHQCHINYSTFNNIENSIVLIKSDLCEIYDNEEIHFKNTGIFLWQSDYTKIFENKIGDDIIPGKTGINILWSDDVEISNNQQIMASNSGISGYFASRAKIIENNITVVQDVIYNNELPYADQGYGSGIHISYGNECEISHNPINSTPWVMATGIESINGKNNKIGWNTIELEESQMLYRRGAIRSYGSTADTILWNELYCDPSLSGIIANNSTGNVFKCNEIYNADYGLGLLYNSAGQTIKGNFFNNSRIDLGIRSETGRQIHEGNDFVGGSVRAEGLDEQELNNSRFIVNSEYPYHMPFDPIPEEGWFFDEEGDDFSCYGQIVTDLPEFYMDTMALCKYYNRLKELKDSLPNVFFVNLFHILKYEQTNKSFRLPDCIRKDSLITHLCGLTELVEVDRKLTTLGEPLDERDPVFIQLQKIN